MALTVFSPRCYDGLHTFSLNSGEKKVYERFPS